MDINTTARHFELSSDDRQFALGRIEKFARFATDIKAVHLVVTAENFRYIAEATLSLNQRELVVREEATEPRRAIDLLADRVEQQLRRVHDKRVDHKRAPRVNGETELAPADGDDESGDAGED